jgi:hypothetical protein
VAGKAKGFAATNPLLHDDFHAAGGFATGCPQPPEAVYQPALSGFSGSYTEAGTRPPLHWGQVGMVGVLHTWGRTLTYQPHVHYLVPAGGVDQATNWLPARNAFLLPVKSLGKIFRAKFHQALRKSACYDEIPAKIWRQPWVVHCKAVGDVPTGKPRPAPYRLKNSSVVSCSMCCPKGSSRCVIMAFSALACEPS